MMGIYKLLCCIWNPKYYCSGHRWIFHRDVKNNFPGDSNNPTIFNRKVKSNVNYKWRVASILKQGKKDKFR